MRTTIVESLEEKDLRNLAERFYNDTYLMDQKACSSPHLLIWLGAESANCRRRFWDMLNSVAIDKYQLDFVESVDKLTRVCQDAVQRNDIVSFDGYGTLAYRVVLQSLPMHSDELKGTFGYFYEYEATDLNELTKIITDRYQTMTYFGLDKDELYKFVIEGELPGIDRLVPVGEGLDIGVVWDGYDVIGTLSRIIDIR